MAPRLKIIVSNCLFQQTKSVSNRFSCFLETHLKPVLNLDGDLANGSYVLLLQVFIVLTDRSQLHLELLADVHPIHLWVGMNAGCRSLGSGNTAGGGTLIPRAIILHLQALTFNGPALKHRLLPATMKRHHYKFNTASKKENIVLLNNSMYIITMHFLYKAVCI